MLRTAAAIPLLWVLASCRPAPGPVDLSGAWPAEPRDYRRVTRDWTRSGRVLAGFENHKTRLLDLRATFRSPEWRAAYVELRSRKRMLPPDQRAALIEEMRRTDEEHYEVVLLVATHDPRANDLQKGKRSIWRIALVNDRGEEVEPVEVRRDRRPRAELRSEYPHLAEFDTVYLARFPRTIELLRAGAERFSLKMGSEMGGVELVWRAR